MTMQRPHARAAQDNVYHDVSAAWQYDGVATHGIRGANGGGAVPSTDALGHERNRGREDALADLSALYFIVQH